MSKKLKSKNQIESGIETLMENALSLEAALDNNQSVPNFYYSLLKHKNHVHSRIKYP